MSLLVWASIVGAFFVYEMFALARSTDPWQPFTYYVRRLIRSRPLWVLALAFWVWVGFHFFIDS